jgi:pre-mRNA-splicing factor SYF1
MSPVLPFPHPLSQSLTMTNVNTYSTDVSFIASQAIARTQGSNLEPANGDGDDDDNNDAMANLDKQQINRAPIGFVAASTGPEGGNKKGDESSDAPPQPVLQNPDALDVDLDDI